MSSYASDEEQVEALKSWWNENGTSLLTGVALVLAVFFGMRQWQSENLSEAGNASDLYQQIAELSINSLSIQATPETVRDAMVFYTQLKNEYPDSIYTRYAAMSVAKFLVETDQYEQAASELQWILDNPDLGMFQDIDEELFLIVRLRLARIKLGIGDAQTALALIHEVDPGPMTSAYADLEGDVLLSLGQTDEAKAAYQKALATNTSGNPVLLQLKLQDLGVSPVNLDPVL